MSSMQIIEKPQSAPCRPTLDFLARFEHGGNDFLDQIVTGNDSWFHYWTLKSKKRSDVWKLAEENMPGKFKKQPSAIKLLGTILWD